MKAMTPQPRHCDLDACWTCTGCAHSHHDQCAGTVTCPTTGNRNRCRCCGGGRK